MSGSLLAGVIGWPVAHSLSPVLHGYWLREHNIDGFYIPLAVRREEFARVIVALVAAGFRGVNVTIPHKEAAYALAHRYDAAARQAEAANLLLFGDDGCIEARNTDSSGLVDSLVQALGGDAIRDAAVVLLGAGGAARAAVFSMDALGAGGIHILNRDRARAERMVAALQPKVRPRLSVIAPGELPGVAGRAVLLVNATSGGMKGAEPLSLSLDKFGPAAAVCDLVYNPIETALLKDARARGHLTVDGLGMLIHQGVPAFEAFFGTRPVVSDGVRRTLLEALVGR